MGEPIATAALRAEFKGCGNTDLSNPEDVCASCAVLALCDEVERLRAEMDVAKRRCEERTRERDALRAAHSGLLRRLRDEMNAWRPGEPGAKECATRVLRALGDEVGD